jgi:outer membrane protein assembly factor BamB
VTQLVLMLAAITSATGENSNWPGFLGGTIPAERSAVANAPLEWSPTTNIAWSADLPGYGQSSPVVWGDVVIVTSVEGPMKDTCHVVALKHSDGSQLWKHSFESSDKVKSSLYVSRAAPTPVCDGKAVYAYFESGDVVALSLDGKLLWHRSLSKEFGKFQNKFGLSASPVQTADSVIVLVDDEGPSYLIALDKATGNSRWKTDRKSRTSWSSPAIVPANGKSQVVVSSAGSVDGYDPATGELLWSIDDVGGNTAATPLPFAEGRFLVGASPGREGGQRAELATKSNLAIAIDEVDGKPAPRVLWTAEKAMPSFGSPMVHKGYAYWVNRTGAVYCFDASTGELKYNERTKQSVWATPIGIGDRVYLFGKEGTTTVLAAGPEFKVLAENQLWDPAAVKPDPAAAQNEDTEEKRNAAAMFSGPVQYGVAAVHDGFLIRTGQKLYSVREK